VKFSQAISEGDGISLIVDVADADAARAAAIQGAEAVVVRRALGDQVDVPLLWRGSARAVDAAAAGADAWVASLEEAGGENDDLGLDRVVAVCDEEELELALERFDPEIVLFSVGGDDDADALQRALDLLPDLPAGKLAIAEVPVSSREQVDELERAGVDAVIVGARSVAGLVGDATPEV
jgi:NAD(P)H-dependent flavin oxidoreductase YrpB (nitropropane dioxygenase family)